MAGFAPFEPAPHLAVAVSGGADSLALALLADSWARARGGRVTALTVDHGLRKAAAEEARQTGRWLAAAGVRHAILTWRPAASAKKLAGGARLANLQAAARDARFMLLEAWCRDHAVLHLLLAHHREDQAETLLLRLARGSGLDGLSAMMPLAERAGVRLLRPLLAVAKAELVAFLQTRGQPWIEDPSNRDPANARVRLRALMPRLADRGLTPARLAETAARLGQARSAIDGAVNRLLASAVTIYPEGYLRLDVPLLRGAEREVGQRALSRIIACIGGQIYGPRLERLTGLYDRLREVGGAGAGLAGGRTLGGCRIIAARHRDGDASRHVIVMREPAAVAAPLPWRGTDAVLWDGRFRIDGAVVSGAAHVRALGESGLMALGDDGRSVLLARHLPRDVALALPALWRGDAVWAVPHLGYCARKARIASFRASFSPLTTLTRPGFTLV